MNSKKILFFHSSSDLYGASKIFLQIILLLKKNGYNTVAILPSKGLLVDRLKDENIDVRILKLGILRRKYINFYGILNRIYYISLAIYKIRKIIKNENINVVYNNTTSIFSVCFASKITNVYHLWHIHEIITKPKWMKNIVAFLISNFSDWNIFVSEATYHHWIKNSLKIKKKSETIHNGFDIEKFANNITPNPYLDRVKKDENTIWIGVIARVHFWKGQDYFLQIAYELLKKHDNIKFLMAGDAFAGYEYLYKKIDDLKKELGLTDKVVDLGYVANPKHFFECIDMFILPSILPDPFPTTALEAMSSKLPIFATQHGGVLEMIENEKSGYFIPFDNAVKSAEIISPLISNKEKRETLGLNAYNRLNSTFNVNAFETKILNRIETIFDGLKK